MRYFYIIILLIFLNGCDNKINDWKFIDKTDKLTDIHSYIAMVKSENLNSNNIAEGRAVFALACNTGGDGIKVFIQPEYGFVSNREIAYRFDKLPAKILNKNSIRNGKKSLFLENFLAELIEYKPNSIFIRMKSPEYSSLVSDYDFNTKGIIRVIQKLKKKCKIN